MHEDVYTCMHIMYTYISHLLELTTLQTTYLTHLVEVAELPKRCDKLKLV